VVQHKFRGGIVEFEGHSDWIQGGSGHLGFGLGSPDSSSSASRGTRRQKRGPFGTERVPSERSGTTVAPVCLDFCGVERAWEVGP